MYVYNVFWLYLPHSFMYHLPNSSPPPIPFITSYPLFLFLVAHQIQFVLGSCYTLIHVETSDILEASFRELTFAL